MGNNIVPDRIGVFDGPLRTVCVCIASSGGFTASGTVFCADCNRPLRGHTAGPQENCAVCQIDKPPLQPLHDRVLVRRSHEETSKGLIVIPDVAREKALRGVVVAVGPGRKDSDGVFRETMVKPGDVVIFSGSVNVAYPDLVEEGELVMMSEQDILGIVK